MPKIHCGFIKIARRGKEGRGGGEEGGGGGGERGGKGGGRREQHASELHQAQCL